MNSLNQTIQNALTSVQERKTTALPTNTQVWEKWANFQTMNDPQLRRMLLEVARFVLDMKEGGKPRWLSLVGNSGTGKTMLVKRVWRWWNETGRNNTTVSRDGLTTFSGGDFCFWPNMADSLKANAGYELLEDYKLSKFLIIDDIGQNRDVSGHATEKLSILMSNRVNKWTLLTSNLSLKDIATKLDPRISSRMIRDGSTVVDVDCQDYNLRVKPAL